MSWLTTTAPPARSGGVFLELSEQIHLGPLLHYSEPCGQELSE